MSQVQYVKVLRMSTSVTHTKTQKMDVRQNMQNRQKWVFFLSYSLFCSFFLQFTMLLLYSFLLHPILPTIDYRPVGSNEPTNDLSEANLLSMMLHRTSGKEFPHNIYEICRRPGYVCRRDDILWKLKWTKIFHPPVLSLDWLPPTLDKLSFHSRYGQKSLRTRNLPRWLALCHLQSCDIVGEVNLQTLPATMEVFSVMFNKISGPVTLARLPPNIRIIDLFWNPFTFCLVDNVHLPESLDEVYLRHPESHLKIKYIDKGKKAQKPHVSTTSMTETKVQKEYSEG